MEKLKLNKKVVSSLNEAEMIAIKGGTQIIILGISVRSCRRGSRLKKKCCKS